MAAPTIEARPYHKNPRKITRRQRQDLAAWLQELGDLSGVVHDLNSGEIIGGNQRSNIFELARCEIEIIQKFDPPDHQGTAALGFIIWQGARYSYRAVRWTPEQCERACIIANAAGGTWDRQTLATGFEKTDLVAWGLNAATLKGFDSLKPGSAADAPAQAARPPDLVGHIRYKPKFNKKRGIRFLSIRSWNTLTKEADLAALKEIKKTCPPAVIEQIAGEFAQVIRDVVKNTAAAFVTNPPRGHAKTEQHFATLVARRTAALLGCEYLEVFTARNLKSTSHPRNYDRRGEITLQVQPARAVAILVDDVATSGATVENCAQVLGAACFVFPIVWIYEDSEE